MPLEKDRHMTSLPPMSAFRYEPAEARKWERWVQGFLPDFASADADARVHACSYLRRQYVISRHVNVLEMMWEFGKDTEDAHVLPEILSEVIRQDTQWYPWWRSEILSSLKSSTVIPQDVKATYFPQESPVQSRSILRQRRIVRDTLFEKMLAKGDFPSDHHMGIVLLKRLYKKEVGLPENPKFTRQVMEQYKEKKKPRKKMMKYLRKIAKRFPGWAKTQTEKLDGP